MMVEKKSIGKRIGLVAAVVCTFFTHWVVFWFIWVNSGKTKSEAAQLSAKLPATPHFLENYKYILDYRHNVFIRSLFNSLKLTIFSISILILVSSMAAFVLQRRPGRISKASHKLIIAGLIVPLSVIPTFWVLHLIGVDGTLPGLVLVEIATMFAFSTMVFKDFIATIPSDIDNAAIIDGANLPQLFFRIVFPLLKPVTTTIIILKSVEVYNDFYNPLYFMSGANNTTVQLCVYLFQSSFNSNYEHLFAVVCMTIVPPLVMFLFLNKQIIGGMTVGSVKG